MAIFYLRFGFLVKNCIYSQNLVKNGLRRANILRNLTKISLGSIFNKYVAFFINLTFFCIFWSKFGYIYSFSQGIRIWSQKIRMLASRGQKQGKTSLDNFSKSVFFLFCFFWLDFCHIQFFTRNPNLGWKNEFRNFQKFTLVFPIFPSWL